MIVERIPAMNLRVAWRRILGGIAGLKLVSLHLFVF